MNVHAIVGNGEANGKVITESLRDALGKGDAVAFPWVPNPADDSAWDVIQGFVYDEEIPYTIYYEEGQTVPRALRETDFGVVQKVRDPFTSALRAADSDVLFLWEDDGEDEQVFPVFDQIDKGVKVLILNHGLEPIEIDEDQPVPSEPDEAEEEKDDGMRLSKLELESMTAGAVKTYGQRLGTKAATKSGIIAELFPPEEEDTSEETNTTTDVKVDDKPATRTPLRETSAATPEHQAIVDKHNLKRSLTNISPDSETVDKIESLRKLAIKFGEALIDSQAPSRERSLAATHLEESVMWAVKGLVLSSEK